MEKDKFDSIIREELHKETADIRMSNTLRDNILKSTVKKPATIFEKVSAIMNSTIEISIPPAAAACIVLIAITFTGLFAWNSIKHDRSLEGYTNMKVIDMGGCSIIVNSYDSRGDIFENQN